MKQSSFPIILLALIVLQLPGLAQQPKSAERERQAKSITGRVVNEGGQPIPNAAIYVNQMGVKRVSNRSLGTDEEGRFIADDLAVGTYYISAHVPGYVQVDNLTQETYYRLGDSATIRMTKGGVITGTVTSATGEPIVAVKVQVALVRDLDGRPVRRLPVYNERPTDDRGIYRLYGLPSGIYLVMATGQSQYFGIGSTAYDDNTPTYYPASTRDTAAEVIVRAGDEVTGIDIRYRGERGHAVSGNISGPVKADASPQGAFLITLTHAHSGAVAASGYIFEQMKKRSFAFYGVQDGEYELTARSATNADNVAASASSPRRVTVKGADVTGVELALVPLGSIAGRIILEPLQEAQRKAECEPKRRSSLEEILVTARRDEKADKDKSFGYWESITHSASSEAGEFTIQGLRAGRFRLESQLPGESWYVRALVLPGSTPAKQNSAAQNGLSLKQGEQISGVTVNLAEGAASLRGKVVSSIEGASLPSRLRVYLVPADRQQADNLLRYAEAGVQADGAFTLTSVAPGRYWLVARPLADSEVNETLPRPLAWDATDRANLRREAEAINAIVEFSLCQRVADYALRFAPTAPRPPAKKTD